jgi:hypothetical protein
MAGLYDPKTQALLAFGSNLLANSGPSTMPVSLGQAMGRSLAPAMEQFNSARQANMLEQVRAAQLAEMKRKAEKDAADQQIRGLLFKEMGIDPSQPSTINGVLSGGPRGVLGTPDRLERLGTYMAISGDAGAATLVNAAERMRQRDEERRVGESFKSAPGVLGAGVTSTSAQGQALLSNLTGDQDFDAAVLQAQNEALNSAPGVTPQAMQAPRPGLFAPLQSSPYVGPYAEQLQQQLDQTSGLKPQQWLSQYDRLQQQHMTATNQAAARQENASLRRDLADQQDQTRRFLAGLSAQGRQDRQADLDAQRGFTRERSLANDYGKLAEDFRMVLPAFQTSAQYLAGKKYNSSGDRALAFAFARTLDPRDRVGVRDIADIQKLGNLPERFQEALQSLAQGKQLPDRVRLEMFDVMRRNFENMNAQQQQIEDEYERRAKSYMIRPENVVERYSIRGKKNGGWSAKEKK